MRQLRDGSRARGRLVVDRPGGEAGLALAAAWLAFMAGSMAGGGPQDLGSLASSGVLGAVFVFVGFAAVSRCRVLPPGLALHRGRPALLALAAGSALGLANLSANWAIAEAHPTLRALLAARMAFIGPVEAVIAAPPVEEVSVRLFLMSAIAWAVFRLTRRTAPAFVFALVASSLIFAALHLARPMPDDPVLANYYRAALLAKYTLLGLPLGWIFWRWGLPYAILCHAATNAAHLAFESRVF